DRARSAAVLTRYVGTGEPDLPGVSRDDRPRVLVPVDRGGRLALLAQTARGRHPAKARALDVDRHRVPDRDRADGGLVDRRDRTTTLDRMERPSNTGRLLADVADRSGARVADHVRAAVPRAHRAVPDAARPQDQARAREGGAAAERAAVARHPAGNVSPR